MAEHRAGSRLHSLAAAAACIAQHHPPASEAAAGDRAPDAPVIDPPRTNSEEWSALDLVYAEQEWGRRDG